MHKFGDVVNYSRSGVEMNAIVLTSRVIDGVEHISLAYPNQDIAGSLLTAQNTAKAILIDFDVLPMSEGANRGWGYCLPKSAPIHIPVPEGMHKNPELPGELIKDVPEVVDSENSETPENPTVQ